MVKIRLNLDGEFIDLENNTMELDFNSMPRKGEKITIPDSEYKEFYVSSIEHLIENKEVITTVNIRRAGY